MRHGPNGKTIRRVLMRRRVSALWGQRAYVRIRVPTTAFPEPPPAFTPPGKPGALEGMWSNQEPDGTYALYDISRIASGAWPKEAESLFVEGSDEDGYLWWEGRKHVYSDSSFEKFLRTETLPHSMVGAYRAQRNWIWDYCVHCRGGTPVLCALHECVGTAAASYQLATQEEVILTFGAKWRYSPDGKRRLCAALRRLFKTAGQHGYKLKLLR